jgi:AcrR family transcriptional regulator
MPRPHASPRASAEAAGGDAKVRRRDAEVLNAAAEIFYERGYAASTVQNVADSLGMLKGSLYHYIDSKEDLLYRLMDEVHDGVDEVLGEVQAAEGLSPADRLELYVKSAVEFNARNLKKVSVYYHDIDQLSGDRRNDIVSRRRVHEDQIINLIRTAQAEGDVNPELDPKLLSNCVFATIIWMYRWYRPGRGVSIEKLSETSALFARCGLRGMPAQRGGRGTDGK